MDLNDGVANMLSPQPSKVWNPAQSHPHSHGNGQSYPHTDGMNHSPEDSDDEGTPMHCCMHRIPVLHITVLQAKATQCTCLLPCGPEDSAGQKSVYIACPCSNIYTAASGIQMHLVDRKEYIPYAWVHVSGIFPPAVLQHAQVHVSATNRCPLVPYYQAVLLCVMCILPHASFLTHFVACCCRHRHMPRIMQHTFGCTFTAADAYFAWL